MVKHRQKILNLPTELLGQYLYNNGRQQWPYTTMDNK